MSSFSDPTIIGLLQERFVPVADNDWYNRRREDAIGTFFREMADQGPRKGEGGSTRQGHYIFTASGKLLGFNNHRAPDRRLAFIRDALAKWDALPPAEREPGPADPPPGPQADPRYAAAPPVGGLVLNSFTRTLKPDGDSPAGFTRCQDADIDHPGGHFAAFDHVWIQADEWAALREIAESGGGDVPEPIAVRLLRFHLVDNTRGEPPFWERDEIRDFRFEIQPTDEPRRFRLSGHALLATSANPESADRGYDADLLGTVEITEDGSPGRFDLVALGQHWGEGSYTLNARPGNSPLGIAFELAARDQPSDEIRPQASGFLKGYWEAHR
ncbi:hypothetical protein BH23VER1_BH23VER1_31910 [soil metagenome]